VIFPVQNGVKQGGVLPQLFFNIALEYTIRNGQENKRVLGQQLLVSADDVNLLSEIINTKIKTQKLYYVILRGLVSK
jgi:hypothetical protein